MILIFVFLSINSCSCQNIDNSTVDGNSTSVLTNTNENILSKESNVKTQITVESNVDFDVVGDYFKVKLSDVNNVPIPNTKITFTVNNVKYNKNTDSNGIATVQLRLNDGEYNIISKFGGNSKYKSSTLTTKVTMLNTRIVDGSLSNLEIQNIIDNAKVNNVILFKGSTYSDINLIITKSLTLISNVDTTLKSSSNSPVITIKGNSASLSKIIGFNIEGNGDGIEINGADYVTVYNNKITTKGNGIVSLNTKYLNITKNNIVKNSKSGIVIGNSDNSYIFNNKINNNGNNGIEIAKSSKTYIHGNTISNNGLNGIYTSNKVNGFSYNEGPQNLYISKNSIKSNGRDGIYINVAGDNIRITGNTISNNEDNGISLAKIGNNLIQSNSIEENRYGIKFLDSYVKPKNQDISYNAIVNNMYKQLDAKDTYYQDNGNFLDVGNNWYGDYGFVCPKIKTNNLKFVVKQVGKNTFTAIFYDSKGNVASLLPDRILSYNNGGESFSMTISGGMSVFNIDASDGDIVKASVDMSDRNNVYDYKINSDVSKYVNGQTPTYFYPNLPNYQLFEDIGGNGEGFGEGIGGNSNGGNGQYGNNKGSSNNANSTHNQKSTPGKNADNNINDILQNYETNNFNSPEGASASNGNSQKQSVVKQILLDEDDIFKVAGISFIVAIMILTIGFYYRDDIKELNSKR